MAAIGNDGCLATEVTDNRREISTNSFSVAPRAVSISHHTASMTMGATVMSELLTSGASAAAANIITNPLDVIKVRMQMGARTLGASDPTMTSTGLAVVRREGVTALLSGMGPTIARGVLFGGAALGFYTPIKAMACGDEEPSLVVKVLAGSLSGGLAAAASSPIELIKTRLQAAGATAHSATTSLGIIRSVAAADGVAQLWRGSSPGVMRLCVMTASQCATYDEVKRGVEAATGLDRRHVGVHISSSMIAGLVTTTLTNPFDVIKTRMYLCGGRFRGPLDCAAQLLALEGPGVFMRGWTASYARLGPHTTIMFLVAEKLRSWAGLESL